MAVRVGLILTALAFMALFLLLPLLIVFAQALSAGLGSYLSALDDPNVASAIGLTVLIAAIAVPGQCGVSASSPPGASPGSTLSAAMC